jgi:hypothetical protein
VEAAGVQIPADGDGDGGGSIRRSRSLRFNLTIDPFDNQSAFVVSSSGDTATRPCLWCATLTGSIQRCANDECRQRKLIEESQQLFVWALANKQQSLVQSDKARHIVEVVALGGFC